MINTSKPTTSFTNNTKPSLGETWDNNLQTWAADTTTWDESGSLIGNNSKPATANITNTTKPV